MSALRTRFGNHVHAAQSRLTCALRKNPFAGLHLIKIKGDFPDRGRGCTGGLRMKRSNARSYRESAAIYTWLAEQAASDEAKAKLVYEGETWLVAAKVTDIIEEKGAGSPARDDPHLLLLE
jgi:hypothetical protein